MPANILSGQEIADAMTAEVAAEVADIREVHGFEPCLVVVRVGDDAASSVYVSKKVKVAETVGIRSEHIHLDGSIDQETLADLVRKLNDRSDVDGILVQLPLPNHIDDQAILELIEPEKDVDGFHPINAGRLAQGRESLVPCTPAGVIEVLKRSEIPIAGANAVVVGRSNIVGKPLAALLLAENATVTTCHSRTKDLAAVASQADILVAAIGRPAFISAEHIKPGATVIDVGINPFSDVDRAFEVFAPGDVERRIATIEKRGSTLMGDVNQRDAIEHASHFTPVPGGIGLLTVAMLMKNTLKAAKMRRGI